MQTNQILVSCGVIARTLANKRDLRWLVVRASKDNGWEMPKITVRKGESSVRAALRMASEMANMNARILEEAGRQASTVAINGKTAPKRVIYYAMIQKSGGEVLGFAEHKWLEYNKARRMLESKKEKEALQISQNYIKEWVKEKKNLQDEEEEFTEEQ